MADILEHPTFGQPPVENVKAPGPKKGAVSLASARRQKERADAEFVQQWMDAEEQRKQEELDRLWMDLSPDARRFHLRGKAKRLKEATPVRQRGKQDADAAALGQVLELLESMGYMLEYMAKSGPDYETAAALRLLKLAHTEMEQLLRR